MPKKKTPKIENEKSDGNQDNGPEVEPKESQTAGKTPPKEPEPQVPDDRAAFNELLVKFRIALKGEFYNTITDDIATTGGEYVFERPDLLSKKLSDWHQYFDPPIRRQILEYWFTKKNVRVPKEIMKEAGMDDIDKEKDDKEKHHDEKYSVDTKTGVIKVADSSDKTGLSWGEADKLSERIKADLTAAKKEEKKEAEGDSKGLPFTVGPDGNIQIAEGTKLSGENLLILQAINKSQEKGEKRNAREILEEEIKHQDFIDNLRGKGSQGGGPLSTVDEMLKAKELFSMDSGVKEILGKMSEQIAQIGKGTGDSPKVEALTTQITELTRRIDDQDKQALRDQITAQAAKVQSLEDLIKKQVAQTTATNEFSIMGKALDKVDGMGKDIKDTVLTLLSKPAPPMPAGERAAITEAIGDEASKITAKHELGKQIFNPSAKGG